MNDLTQNCVCGKSAPYSKCCEKSVESHDDFGLRYTPISFPDEDVYKDMAQGLCKCGECGAKTEPLEGDNITEELVRNSKIVLGNDKQYKLQSVRVCSVCNNIAYLFRFGNNALFFERY